MHYSAAMGNRVPLLLSREDLAWAAGFFDGEGCFSFSEAGHYICVSIGQTDREPLDRFRIAVGGLGKVLGPYELARPGRLSKKPQYVYRANRFEHVQAIAAMLWFKLGTPKEESGPRSVEEDQHLPVEDTLGSLGKTDAASAPPCTGKVGVRHAPVPSGLVHHDDSSAVLTPIEGSFGRELTGSGDG